MKVKELIEELKNVDPALEVVVRGYESGVNKVNEVVCGFARIRPDAREFEGDYEFDPALKCLEDIEDIKAVWIKSKKC